jgi:hypothetical protein
MALKLQPFTAKDSDDKQEQFARMFPTLNWTDMKPLDSFRTDNGLLYYIHRPTNETYTWNCISSTWTIPLVYKDIKLVEFARMFPTLHWTDMKPLGAVQSNNGLINYIHGPTNMTYVWDMFSKTWTTNGLASMATDLTSWKIQNIIPN